MLLDLGYADQLFLSQDVCKVWRLRRFGGNGCNYVLRTLFPKPRQAGVPEALITKMMVEKPKKALTIKDKQYLNRRQCQAKKLLPLRRRELPENYDGMLSDSRQNVCKCNTSWNVAPPDSRLPRV